MDGVSYWVELNIPFCIKLFIDSHCVTFLKILLWRTVHRAG